MAQVLHYEVAYGGTCPQAVTLPKTSVPLITALERVIRTVVQWNERSRQRQALADLDDRLLQDIGITRSAAAAESSQPFWR